MHFGQCFCSDHSAEHQKLNVIRKWNKMFNLDYIQLLMISWVIWAKNIDQNAKKWKRPPKSEWSEQKTLTKMQKNEKGPLSHQKIKCSFLDYFQLLMIGQAIWVKNVNRNAKKQKGPLSHWKIKCSFLDYVQLLMISQAIWAKNVDRNTKKQKRPLSHWKIKCSFLDYIQLLMIGQAIWAKNVDQTIKKTKKAP